MIPEDVSPTPSGGTGLPRWVQVPLGLFLGAFTLLCLAGSAMLIFSPTENAPILTIAVGVACFAACVWLLEKSFRLLTGRKRQGGLISPRALRFFAWCFLLLPAAGLFTGYFKSHTLLAVVQTVAYVGIFWVFALLCGKGSHRLGILSQDLGPAQGFAAPAFGRP